MSDLTPAAAIRTAVFSSAVPAAPAPAPPAPTTPTAPAIPVEPYSPAGLSPSHAAQIIEWEKDNLAKGKITPEEAARRFDALGATPEQRAPDTRTAVKPMPIGCGIYRARSQSQKAGSTDRVCGTRTLN